MTNSLDFQLFAATLICFVTFVYNFYASCPLLFIINQIVASLVSSVCWSYFACGCFYFIVGVIFIDIYRLQPSDKHALVPALIHYIFNRVLYITALYQNFSFQRQTRDVENTQNKVLKNILSKTKSTVYAMERGLNKVESRDEFLRVHPVIKYDYISPYVDRVMEGEDGVFFPEKVDYLCATTGTTSGKSKFFPINSGAALKQTLKGVVSYFHSILQLPSIYNLKKRFMILFKKRIRRTHLGFKIGPISAIFTYGSLSSLFAVPEIVGQIPDMNTSFYVQQLYLLRDKEIGNMEMIFASHFYTFIKFMENNWRDLCHDIRYGQINSRVSPHIPPYIREKLTLLSHADPVRAEELEAEFRSGFQDIMERLWPCLAVITFIGTGPFAVYKSMVQRLYTGKIPLVTPIHGATESFYGANIWCGEKYERFIILLNQVFFEFIEERNVDQDNPPTYLARQVEIGKKYEIVVTTERGLYRYRMNDMIEIVGFHNQTPVYNFLQRADDNLSLYGEKTPISAVETVLQKVSSEWSNCKVVDYTTTESVNVMKLIERITEMCYIIILEVKGEPLTEVQISQLDGELMSHVEAYRIYREKNRFGPLKVLYADEGSFDDLRHSILANNIHASRTQLKIPRLIRKEDFLKSLLSSESNEQI